MFIEFQTYSDTNLFSSKAITQILEIKFTV
jgi:hypothetical protein